MDTIPLLLLYTFAAFGLCWTIGGSKLTLALRNRWAELAGEVDGVPSTLEHAPRLVLRFFLQLVECPACLGFWVGLLAAYRLPDLAGELQLVPGSELVRALSLGFYTLGVNYCLARATGLLDHP